MKETLLSLPIQLLFAALKKTFSQSNARKAFKALSEYFIMVNTADDDEPYEEVGIYKDERRG